MSEGFPNLLAEHVWRDRYRHAAAGRAGAFFRILEDFYVNDQAVEVFRRVHDDAEFEGHAASGIQSKNGKCK